MKRFNLTTWKNFINRTATNYNKRVEKAVYKNDNFVFITNDNTVFYGTITTNVVNINVYDNYMEALAAYRALAMRIYNIQQIFFAYSKNGNLL